MYRGISIALVLAVMGTPAIAPAANKDIQELQRDIAQLQDQVRQLKASQDQQLSALLERMQQAISVSTDSSKSVAVIQSGLRDNLREMESKVVTPVAGLGARMDSVSENMRILQQAVTDLTTMLNKLQTQMSDLNNAVKVMQAPPSPPPGGGSAGMNGPGGGAPGNDTPSMSAKDLFENAYRDQKGGKLDLALEEFGNYLRWYGSTDMAPSAQFYIGYIHFGQSDYDNALKDFDSVLTKYSENDRTPQALYYKGLTLRRLGRLTDGQVQFKELINQFPNHDLAKQACQQLKDMGYQCPAARTVPAKSTARRKK